MRDHGPGLITTLLSLAVAVLASCAGVQRAQHDATDEPVDILGQPLGQWPCADGHLPHPDDAQEPELLVALLQALHDNGHAQVEEAGQALFASAIEASRQQFHSLRDGDAPADRGRSHRDFLQTWVYGPVPVLRVGIDRFWLDERLAVLLATNAVSAGELEDARFWLFEAGAPNFLDERLIACLAWIDLQGHPERLDEWVDQIDWQAPAAISWRDRVHDVRTQGRAEEAQH